MFEWIFESDNIPSNRAMANFEKATQFLKLEKNQISTLSSESRVKLQQFGERLSDIPNDEVGKFGSEKAESTRGDKFWSPLHQLGFESLYPNRFQICHEEDPKTELVDLLGKRIRINPKYLNEREWNIFAAVGRVVVRPCSASIGDKQQHSSIRCSSEPMKSNEVKHIFDQAGQASYRARYNFNMVNADHGESRTKVRSWEKPLINSGFSVADKELAEARKKYFNY